MRVQTLLTSYRRSDTSLPQSARKCGFCTHRFVSRQDRIDHIAEHFKNGKCMLDWNEEDVNDSDDMNDDDDNDDRPDSGGFGNGKPFFSPNHDPRGSGSGPKNNGNGGNGSQHSQSGFFQFQVSQLADCDSRGSSPGVEQLIQRDSMGKQHIKPAFGLDGATCGMSPQDALCETTNTEFETPTNRCSVHGRHDETTRDDSQLVAGDDVSLLSSDIVQLQTLPPFVPPSDGDPAPDRLKALTTVSTGKDIVDPRMATKSNHRAGPLSRETQDLLGSLKLLGAGGFSTVDEVVHRETSLRFARKTLKNRERSAIEELKNEVDVLKKLRHPHIIRFVDSVQKGDRMSILLSPVAETTLAAWLDMKLQTRPDRLSETIVTMMGCLASSIRYLHDQRPVVKHMDIKPQNILIKQGEDVPHVFLSDFGVSSIGEITANTKAMPLTRQYCAPEVPEGVSRELASDIWSLGCVFLEMLTVAYKEDNPRWLEFRQLFGGRKGKYYWQDVPAVQGLLTKSLEQAASRTEANATRTVKDMLSSEPAERPTASKLTMVFTPAPCCLSWPNEKVTYPGPSEELQTVKTFFQEDSRDGCAHSHDVDDQHKQQGETVAHAKRWLEECSHDHEDCRHDLQGIFASKTLPTRLIDTLPDGNAGVSVRIVNGADLYDGESPDYAALSYVWADDELKLSTARLDAMQVDLPRDTLPKAINEAIAKAQDIGFRYIWVDSLCVLQDSDSDKERESRAMADVYRNAALTIVTAQKGVDQQALQAAVLPLSTYLTPGFAWDTRAWSLQERLLSRRFLHLGEEQMYWECNALKASETFPRGLESFRHALSSLLWEKVHTKADPLSVIPDTPVLNYDRLHEHRKFDVEGTGTADEFAGKISKLNANGQGAPGANKAKGYGKMATPHQGERDNSPHLLRDCQVIQKEGDGIGDSVEAAQTELQLATLARIPTGTAGMMRGSEKDHRAGLDSRGNGVGEKGKNVRNRGVRRKHDGNENVMG
jgi:serine/threonine protein kinase